MNSVVENKDKPVNGESKSNYESKIENFNSEFYFDDIIKELSDAGFYSNEEGDENKKNEKLIIDKNFFNEIDVNKKEQFSSASASSIIENKFSNSNETMVLNSDFKNEIFGRINRISNKIDNEVRKFNQSIEDIKDLLETNKNSAKESFTEVFSRIMLSNSENEENFNNLFSIFSNKIDNDKTKDIAFEKIYEQMEFFKKDFTSSMTKPIVKDLILFYDRICSNIHHFNDIGDDEKTDTKEEKKEFVDILENFKDEMVEILNRNGIELIHKSKAGEIFDPKKCTVLEKIKTENKDIEDLTIKEVLQEGFKMNGKILRHESVAIYKK